MSPPTPLNPPTLQQLLTRLALAKRLFLKPKSKRRLTQQTTTTKKKPTTTPPTREYSLRKRPPPVTTPTTILTSWRDEDDSTDDDDYDPRIERAYLRRKKPAKRAKTENGNLSLIVKIKINMESEAGKAFLDTLGMYQDDDNDPIVDEKRTKIMGDEDIVEGMSIPSSACKPCIEKGRSCSITSTHLLNDQEPDTGTMKYPCEQCIQDTIICEPMPTQPIPTVPNPYTSPSTTPPPETHPSIIQTITTITTSLTHPITLTPTSQTCSFCPSLPYSLFGQYQPPRTISVLPILPRGNKLGDYMELHPQLSTTTSIITRICVTCALERLRIMLCGTHTPTLSTSSLAPSSESSSTSESKSTSQSISSPTTHKILPLKGYDPNTFDFETAYKNLASSSSSFLSSACSLQPTTTTTTTNPWCSLCPHPAFYGCARLQSRDVYLEEITEPQAMGVGCGLLLCERCEVLMRMFKGRVEDVVRRNEEDAVKNYSTTGDGGIGGSRADVGFLLKGEWLWRVFMGEGDCLLQPFAGSGNR
ncbi:putative C6 finger domain protein [Aspergillus vadensis CBS 113365]|uniref:Uncharacterized protein n=1 Tax=Aspergillus vadensis (strain CBS 113365 / IMI 142717 / IBT 24658) TaxID=1448311 RepID=A0A319BQM3_ASPVC|nr:hypothetical protein BO88DRAFT_327724 [Aspergillus vadensis CBS 113365]PYH74724.1 hypothetical protein BO88DRAFT_327724 [Aspergillus vadensis CBS 113365]